MGIEDRTRPQELHSELEAVGLIPVSVGAAETEIGEIDFGRELTADEQTLADLVVAANRKGVGDPAIKDLRDHLGADERWDAYVAARKAEIDRRRHRAYQRETAILLDKFFDALGILDYNGTKVLTIDPAAIQDLVQARQAIKNALPYGVT